MIAPSGSGKSNFLTNLITLFCKGNEGTFDNILLDEDMLKNLYHYKILVER